MRTDNREVKNTVLSIYFLLVFFTILLATVFKSFEIFIDNSFIVFLGLFIALVVFHSIAGYFEYDSDNAKIVILNKGLILIEYISYKENKLEYSRNQLIRYKIKNHRVNKYLVLLIKTCD